MRSMKLAVAIALVSATSAFAGFVETEPNNTAAQANPIPGMAGCFNANVGLATLAVGGGDVDYYSIVVPGNCILTAITTPMVSLGNDPDTIMDLRTAADVLIVSNDDDG